MDLILAFLKTNKAQLFDSAWESITDLLIHSDSISLIPVTGNTVYFSS